MLPTGHIAAGFLTAHALVKILKPELDQHQINQLLMLGAFAGFAPDLDEFWFFYKNRSLLVAPKAEKNHRAYISHVPVLWTLPGIVLYLLSPNEFGRIAGLIFCLVSLSHFLLDSIKYGIMWLWPFTSKLYALGNAGEKPFVIEEKNFLKHSFKYLRVYAKTVSFYLEIVIVISSIIVYFK